MRSAHLQTVSHFVALIILGLVARAEPPGSTEYWKQAVAKQTLPEIAALMVAGTNSSWPEVKSARQSTGVESAGKIALVKACARKDETEF